MNSHPSSFSNSISNSNYRHTHPSAGETTTTTASTNSSTATSSTDSLAALVECADCGHQVPVANLSIHQAHACLARKRPATAHPRGTPPQPLQRPRSSSLQHRVVSQNDDEEPSALLSSSLNQLDRDHNHRNDNAGRNGDTTAAYPYDEAMTSPWEDGDHENRHHQPSYDPTDNHHPARRHRVVSEQRAAELRATIERARAATQQSQEWRAARVAAATTTSTATAATSFIGQEVIPVHDSEEDGDDDLSHSDVDDDDDDQHPLDREVIHVDDSSDVDDDDDDDVKMQWSCPRCTLLNPTTVLRCDACGGRNPQGHYRHSTTNQVRPPDATVREQLLPGGGEPQWWTSSSMEPMSPVAAAAQSPLRHQPSSPPSTLHWSSGGALLGGVLGAAGAYMQGRSVSDAAFSGAVSGAMSAAVVSQFLQEYHANEMTRAAIDAHHQQQQHSYPPQQQQAHVVPVVQGQPVTITTSHRINSAGQPFITRLERRMGPDGRYSTVVTTTTMGRGPNGPPGGSVTARTPDRGTNHTEHHGSDGSAAATAAATTADAFPTGRDPMLEFIFSQFLDGGGAPPPRRALVYRVPNIDGMSYEQLLQAFGDGTDHLAADPSLIASLPTTKIKDPAILHENKKQCSICLEDFVKGDRVKTMPCWHDFHKKCLDQWLRTNGSCPICKFRLDEAAGGGRGGEGGGL